MPALQSCSAPGQRDETDNLDDKLSDIQIRKEFDPHVNRDPPFYNSKRNKELRSSISKPNNAIDNKQINAKRLQYSTANTKAKIIHKLRRSSSKGKHISKSAQAWQPTPYQRVRGHGATLERPKTFNLQKSASPSNIRKIYYSNKHPDLSQGSAYKKPVRKSSQSTTNNPLLIKKNNIARLNVKKIYNFIQPKTKSTSRKLAPLRRKKGDGKSLQLIKNLSRTRQQGSPRVLFKKIVKYVKKSSGNSTKKPSLSKEKNRTVYVKTIYYIAKPKAKNHGNTSTIQPTRQKIQNQKMPVIKQQNEIPPREPLRNILRRSIKSAYKKKSVAFTFETIEKFISNMTGSKDTLQEKINTNATWLKKGRNFGAGWKAGNCAFLGPYVLELAAIIVYEADILTNKEQEDLFKKLHELGVKYKAECKRGKALFKEASED